MFHFSRCEEGLGGNERLGGVRWEGPASRSVTDPAHGAVRVVGRQHQDSGDALRKPQAGVQRHGTALRKTGQHDTFGRHAAPDLAPDHCIQQSGGFTDTLRVFHGLVDHHRHRGPSVEAIEQVVDECRHLIEIGHKEIVLCGVFLGAYGKCTAVRKADSTPSLLPDLLAADHLRYSLWVDLPYCLKADKKEVF